MEGRKISQRVLVVDDEESIVTLLQFNLEQAGYEVETAMDGETALQKANGSTYDLIVLDLMLPRIDGLEVCKLLRQQKNFTPILMLTAKDDEIDKVLGLELGADDYMTKPFSPREVVARARAILRRIKQQAVLSYHSNEGTETPELITCGEIEIYPDNYEVYFKKEIVDLTPKEFELLLYLARHKGRAFSRDRLLDAVWDYQFVGDTRIVDVHISHLREKLEINTRKPVYIKTIRGLGYKLEDPVKDA